MLRIAFVLIGLSFAALAHAQSLQDQIEAVGAAQDRQAARQAEWLREQAAREDRIASEQRAALVARERTRAAAAQAAHAEALADKRRDQQYEDRLRELDIRQKELELKKLDARARREDEFIDSDLARQRARTDVVQSEADANRNISSGTRTLLQQSGVRLQYLRSDPDGRTAPATGGTPVPARMEGR